VAGDVVTAGAAETGVTQAADGQPEPEKPDAPSEQGGVTLEEGAGGTAARAAARRPAQPRAVPPR